MWTTNEKYTEIKKLNEMLNEADIPHTFDEVFDGFQICYPVERGSTGCVMDAIEHFGSYGVEQNLLEIMGLLTDEEAECDSVAGYLTADNVFNRIKNHYDSIKESDAT